MPADAIQQVHAYVSDTDVSDADSDPDCPRLVDEVETDDGGPERELTRDFGGFNLNRTPPANGTC